LDKLQALVTACEAICAGEDRRFVLIGDYVDRGPDSKGVISYLIDRQSRDPDRFICLRGNHDQMLLAAAVAERSDRDLITWWANGGQQTLDSYGVGDPSEIPKEHLAWLDALPLKFADRHRMFVHAGVRPGISFAEQVSNDLLWIREPFLSSRWNHGLLIVHGHTPTATGLPDIRPNRLDIDTGACFGGPLTAVMFSDRKASPMLYVNHLGEAWSSGNKSEG
jgi:serine/threonine protein phosphatase 1